MKAIVFDTFGGTEVLHEAETDIPSPAPARSVCVYGLSGQPGGRQDPLRCHGGHLPHHAARRPWRGDRRVVDAVGEGVDHLKVGDEVLGWSDTGSYAQYALAPRPSSRPSRPAWTGHTPLPCPWRATAPNACWTCSASPRGDAADPRRVRRARHHHRPARRRTRRPRHRHGRTGQPGVRHLARRDRAGLRGPPGPAGPRTRPRRGGRCLRRRRQGSAGGLRHPARRHRPDRHHRRLPRPRTRHRLRRGPAAPLRRPTGRTGRAGSRRHTGDHAQRHLPTGRAAKAQQASDAGHNRGKIVLTVN